MINNVEVSKIADGPRSAVFHVTIVGNHTGDISKVTLVDPTKDVSPASAKKPTFSLEEIWYDLSGFDAHLDFEYLNENTHAWSCSGGKGTHMDFTSVGGIHDKSPKLDGSGKLTITTSGLQKGGRGSLIIKLKKS